MARTTYDVGGKVFPNKEAIANYVRWIIELTPDGPVTEGFDWLCELAKRHTYADIKIGCGIKEFRVGINEYWGKHRVLTLVRTDGSETDFSWRECVWPTPHKRRVKNACRTAVSEQVAQFAAVAFNEVDTPTCELTGVPLSPGHVHVDHDNPTFDEIVDAWIGESGLFYDDIQVAGLEDGEMRDRFADYELASSFATYHRLNARLRLLSPAANMSRKRR